MSITKAMILAAGKGSRLQPLTATCPKPMLPVGGKPLIAHTLHQLARYGIREAAINLHHAPEVVQNYFGDGSAYGLQLRYSLERTLLGTAGAVKKLESFFRDGTFLLIYGDNLTTCDLVTMTREHQQRDAIATMALFWRSDVSKHSAVEIQPDRRISAFIEKPKPEEAPSHWISAGVLLLEPRILDYIPADHPSDFGFDIFPLLLAKGEKIYGHYMTEQEGLWWIDTVADYQAMCELWKDGFPADRALV